jgi:hypothetical protein
VTRAATAAARPPLDPFATLAGLKGTRTGGTERGTRMLVQIVAMTMGSVFAVTLWGMVQQVRDL